MKTTTSYVYRYSCPIRDEPIYIGKGTGKRLYDHLADAKNSTRNSPFVGRLKWMLEQDQLPIIEIVESGLSEEAAYILERDLIRSTGRKINGSGPLLNLTEGGDGPLGYHHTEEAKQKISQSLSGKTQSLTHVNNNSLAQKGKPKPIGFGAKVSQALQGKTSKLVCPSCEQLIARRNKKAHWSACGVNNDK